MIHVGVDLHQRFCYMTALEARGKILQAGTVTNEKLALRRYFRQFRGKEVQVAVEACGFWPARSGGTGSETVGVGASAAGQGDCQCQAEERPGGLGHAGALVALRLVAGVVEGGPGDAGAAAAGAFAGDVGAASDAAEEPGARGAASAGAAFAGDGCMRQTWTAVAGGSETASAGTGIGKCVFAAVGRLQRRNSKTKSATK